ncbi:glycosyltransferase [Frigoriglobus tundricola]|uniref:GT4 family glycosyltransferase n=1 Tax=Frigoriglobus tundricola TaxID=2774151 RepID=A0A6M5YVW4_9BACT|nr:glycosyltransferase [Frigoriglobus tundricola]QJW98068.1 GT4 family glycosyltransferase [Frigoriglobus tundricola]
MRILAMTNLYPNPYQPHRATFNRHQFRILGGRHPVQVIAPIAWTDEFTARRGGGEPLPAGRRVARDGLTVDHPRYLFPPKIARGWYGRFYLASVARTFRRAVREFGPDLVFTPWAYPDGWAAVRLGRSAHLPVVLQVHGSDVLLLDQAPARRRRTEEAVRAADGVVAVSHDLAGHLARMGVGPTKVRVIHDGVDRALFAPGDRAAERAALGVPAAERMLLFVGNLLPVKALDVLLRACAEPLLKGTPFRLAVVGQGPLRPALEQLAGRLGVADRVRFVGPLAQTELPRWYRAADVFVLPSHSEGVPNVLLEASACGTPWVASRVGGVPEIAGLGRSRLVPPNAPVELAAAIHETLTAEDRGHPSGPKPREEAVSELIEFLESVLSRHRRSGI